MANFFLQLKSLFVSVNAAKEKLGNSFMKTGHQMWPSELVLVSGILRHPFLLHVQIWNMLEFAKVVL